MPQDSSWAVQAAVYSRLCADAGLTSLLAAGAASIFDHVPQGSAFPYIALGSLAARPLETQGGGGYDISLDIHCYSRALGMKQARAVMAAVASALHGADFAVTGQVLVLCRLTEQETALEPDGETRHGLQRFTIITEPA
jgi:hypothetical protein